MKKNDWILAGTVLVAALFFLAGNVFSERKAKDAEKYLKIKVDGEVFREVSLKENEEIAIGEHNRVKIENGQAEMIWADCPDQICVRHSKISKNRESIICLPNKVILEIVDKADEGSKENDAVAG
ncbi:MAG: NusG domain II-containing protein [Lachnospiraceae bacterium]|nr:NusG domain II-containing protein [Lachnospiraceae bacterium]